MRQLIGLLPRRRRLLLLLLWQRRRRRGRRRQVRRRQGRLITASLRQLVVPLRRPGVKPEAGIFTAVAFIGADKGVVHSSVGTVFHGL